VHPSHVRIIPRKGTMNIMEAFSTGSDSRDYRAEASIMHYGAGP